MTRIDHTTHDHPNTKAARAKCRRDAKIALVAGDQLEAANTVSIHTVIDQATQAYIADQAVASITTPNGTVIREGDIVTLTDSKIEREVVAITDGATITARRIDAGTRQVEVTTDKLNGVKVISA